MLAAVKGVYEKGVIKPLEPIGLKRHVDVIITFLAPADAKQPIKDAAGAWNGLDIKITKRSACRRRSRNGVSAKGMDAGKGKIHTSFYKPLPQDVLDSFGLNIKVI